jgi:hypothetical protein
MRAYQASAPIFIEGLRRPRRDWAFSVLAASMFVACSGTPNTEACGVAGRERTCPCESNAIGIQSCQLDGTWEACTCYPLDAGATAAGSSAAGTAGGVAGAGGMSAAGANAGRGGGGFAGFLGGLFAGRGVPGRRP